MLKSAVQKFNPFPLHPIFVLNFICINLAFNLSKLRLTKEKFIGIETYSVFVDGAERSAAQLFRLNVMRLEPKGLQLGVAVLGELVVLEDVVQLLEVVAVEGDDCPGAQHGLGARQLCEIGVGHRQWPEEARQPLHVARLLQSLAHGAHLAAREVERRQRENRQQRPRLRQLRRRHWRTRRRWGQWRRHLIIS